MGNRNENDNSKPPNWVWRNVKAGVIYEISSFRVIGVLIKSDSKTLEMTDRVRIKSKSEKCMNL